MTNEGEKQMGYCRSGWGWKCLFFLPLAIGAFLGIGYIVMLLWNAIIPGLFASAGTLTYCHALGLLVLCKILFGGFRGKRCGCGGGWRGRRHMNAAWKEKWSGMTEEEKAKFKEEWKNRCGGRY
ncbi:MAG TPA: hypothetical protein VK806_03465 [Bacteroidia bacterium]|nr:hypothetical protein [Bacteroidia bacterium]